MPLKDNLHKLSYFKAVAEAGSIKEGSSKAFLSQPQMSKVIQQLEEDLGKPLFYRSRSGVKLTKFGDLLYQYTLSTLHSTEVIEAQIRSTNQVVKGSIRVGAYDSIARYFFPDFLKFFKRIHPELSVTLHTGRSNQLVKELEKGKLDLAVLVNAKDYPNTKSLFLYTDHFGLYSAPKMSTDFSNHLIYFDFDDNKTLETAPKFGFTELSSCDNLETVKALAENELGVSLLPHRVAKEGLLKGTLTPFTHTEIRENSFDKHQIDLCLSKSVKSEAFDYFKDELIRFFEIWLKK